MRKCNKSTWWLILLFPIVCLSQEHQSFFPPEEFQSRRAKVFDYIGNEAIAIIQGLPDNGGYIFPRQSNIFYYLSGVENPHSYLLLDGRNRKAILYLHTEKTKHKKRELSLEETEWVKQRTGMDDVLSIDALKIPRVRIVHTPFSPLEGQGQSRNELQRANKLRADDRWDGQISRQHNFISLLRTRNREAEIKDLTPILDKLRTIKSPREIELVKRASKLAALGITEAMRSTKPGGYEYQLDAAARYIFLVNGSKLEGYRSITASGVGNIIDGHYYFNTSPLKDGDLILMDFAPDYGYYTSDIGRMWPVKGKFAPWQRQLCQIILTYHKEILKRIRPGVTAGQIQDEAKGAMEPIFAQTKFIKPVYEKAARKMVDTGGGVFSHMVGMAVHDVGIYKDQPLEPGLVIAIDP